MTQNASMKIDIPGVNFEEMARGAIAERLTEAMLGADDMIRKIVIEALGRKVDDKGQVNSYSHHNNTPFVEWMAQDMIRAATFEVLKAKVEKLRPSIEKAIEAELRRSTKAAAKALTESFVERAKNAYGLSCEIKLNVRSND